MSVSACGGIFFMGITLSNTILASPSSLENPWVRRFGRWNIVRPCAKKENKKQKYSFNIIHVRDITHQICIIIYIRVYGRNKKGLQWQLLRIRRDFIRIGVRTTRGGIWVNATADSSFPGKTRRIKNTKRLYYTCIYYYYTSNPRGVYCNNINNNML